MNNSNNNNRGPFSAESIFQRKDGLSGINFSNGYLNTEKSMEVIPQASACSPCIDVQEEICASLGPFGNICRSIPVPGRWQIYARTKHCGPFDIPCGVEVDLKQC